MMMFINQMEKSWRYSLSSCKSTFLGLSMVFFFNIIVAEISLASNLPFNPLTMSEPDDLSSLKTLNLDGYFIFDDIHHAAKDFGNRYQHLPYAILRPNSVSDISKTVKHVFQMGVNSKLRVAARGHAHSLQGQAQAEQGIVIEMESLKTTGMKIYSGDKPYIDVSGGELWINILHETLKHGLAPKSWTDYLHLTVGGTLSNAGISGQAFRHGPQISNVLQMEIVTGKGEVLNCSEKENADLFHGVLGGLGQLGIITRARISLETAPRMVKWIRILYADFSTFAKDQEHLISSEKTFDYIEGFVIINRTGLLSNWRSSFSPEDPLKASKFISDGKTLYCLEMTKNFNPEDRNNIEQEIKQILSQLSYIPSTLFISEVPYFDFLDRVHISEMNLRSKGLWDVPHPWLNLFIPSTKIHDFAREVFGKILKDSGNGPILIYPLNKTKWDNRTSAVIPDENVFYLVAFLTSALPSTANSLEQLLHQNEKVLEFCEAKEMGVKQYLPHYTVQEDWRRHYGLQWEVLVRRKMEYDPLAILAPGQKIFQKQETLCDKISI